MAKKKTQARQTSKRGRKPTNPKGSFTSVVDGRRQVNPGYERLMIFLESDLAPELAAHAALRKITPSDIINDLVSEFLRKNPIQVRSKKK